MRSRMKQLAAVAAALTWAGTAAGAPRAPTGKWVVDFDDAQCVASRPYGTKDKPLLLALKQPPIGEVMQIAVIRKGGGGRFGEQVDASLRIDGGRPIPVTMVSFAVKERNERVMLLNLPLDQFQAVRKGTTLTIDAGRELNETLQLAEVEPLMRVMDTCIADLRKVWNVRTDPDHPPLLKQSAAGDIVGLFRGDDYPGVSVSQAKSGSVSVAILIDEAGRVADCTIVNTSGVAALDAQSCAVIKQRAKFTPAIGLDGKPAKDAYVQRITWRIEQ